MASTGHEPRISGRCATFGQSATRIAATQTEIPRYSYSIIIRYITVYSRYILGIMYNSRTGGRARHELIRFLFYFDVRSRR